MTAATATGNRPFEKVVLITGGSKGIGAGCARVFCAAGARVMICARGREAGEALAAELSATGPGECRFEVCDVSKPEDIKQVVEKTVQGYGRLDCLINNAGTHPPHAPIDDFSVEDFKDLLQINLVSYFAAATPRMRLSERILPGSTQLTRTPLRASSMANAFVNALIPPLVAQ